MEIAQYYTNAFFADCKKLNIKRPDVVQPATGCIDEYIKIIAKLMDTGYAYFAGGNVYFDTSRLDHYYVFSVVLHGDTGALNVPSRITDAPWRVPFERLVLEF